MLRELEIKNFKAWASSGKIRMAPLTIFCGNNSSGKSSINQFLLMLKQTVESYDRYRVLHFGDKDSIIDLGTYKDIICKGKTDSSLEFGLEYDTSSIKIFDATSANTVGTFNKIKFESTISQDQRTNKTLLNSFAYTLINGTKVQFKLSYEQGKYKLTSTNYTPKRQTGRVWQLPHPEHFYGFPNEAIAYYQNTGFLPDLSLSLKNFFKTIFYLGPLRDKPERFYQFSGEVPPDVGLNGKIAINAILAASTRKLSRGYKLKQETFNELVGRWLKQMELIKNFEVIPIEKSSKLYEVRIQIGKDSPKVLITEVGFGISQVLPVIVQCFYAPEKSTLIFEQPEIHLHPSVQSHLGDLFIEAIHSRENGKEKKIQIIVESHSEHLIRRIQRRIADKTIQREEVAIYFVKQENGEASLEEMNIDLFGNISNWPDNFFGDDLEDLAEMTKAARNRKQTESNV
jgi:predicted ATPase